MSPKTEALTPENENVSVDIKETEVVFDNCPSHEDIAALAYSYWQARGCQGGSPEEDWLRADQELRGGRPEPEV